MVRHAGYKRSSTALLAAAFVLLSCISLIGLDAWRTWQARVIEEREAGVTVANMARALAQHADDTFKEADTVLVGLLERIRYDGLQPPAVERLHRLLILRVKELPQLGGIFIYDPTGRWIVNSQPVIDRSLNNADRDYFIYHRDHSDGGAVKDSSVLVFRIGREWLALPTQVFDAVAPQARTHVLPHRSGGGLSGIVNIGGKLYPCMSLASLLGIDEQGAPPAKGRHTFARLLLMRWEDQSYALPVADLHGIVRYAASAVQTPAATINKGLSRYLSGVITESELRIGCLDTKLIGFQLARLLR